MSPDATLKSGRTAMAVQSFLAAGGRAKESAPPSWLGGPCRGASREGQAELEKRGILRRERPDVAPEFLGRRAMAREQKLYMQGEASRGTRLSSEMVKEQRAIAPCARRQPETSCWESLWHLDLLWPAAS